jgi:hypothetical protein
MTSGVMEAEDGTYLISAHAAPIRGGTAGANAVAYEDAQKFCAAKGQLAGGGTFAAGNVNIRFRCASQPGV